jgi:MYXO-CTERM domain-containing protein
MRRFARAGMMGLLALAPVAAGAATITEDFQIILATGNADTSFTSDPFDLFNPSLGDLTSVSETLTGSTTWTNAFEGGPLSVSLWITGAHETFITPGPIKIDLSGSTTDGLTYLTIRTPVPGGPADTLGFEFLTFSADVGASVTPRSSFNGTITYHYTPAVASPGPSPVPEPPTLAILGLPLAALAALAVARRRTRPAT